MNISFVIPIYNVEKYLRRCLDSVLHQVNVTLEIIRVDDGTKNVSGIIFNEYTEKNLKLSNYTPNSLCQTWF